MSMKQNEPPLLGLQFTLWLTHQVLDVNVMASVSV